MGTIPAAVTHPPVRGMPEGVDFVEMGVAGEGDFELVGGQILKGARAGAASGVLVKPATGYEFKPTRGTFDIKAFELVPGPDNLYVAVRVEQQPATVTIQFSIANSADGAIIAAALEKLKALPGFMSLEQA